MSSARLIDGKAISAQIHSETKARVLALSESRGITPGITFVRVGEDPASQAYVRMKGSKAAEVGIRSDTVVLPEATLQEELMALIEKLNADPNVHGILVQAPLPKQIKEEEVFSAIDYRKDVDGFHPVNAGRLAIGLPSLVPGTPLGCLHLLKAELGSLSGLDAVVIGRSNIVGKPMAQLLIAESTTVTVAHSKTRDLPDVVRRADIVVAAVGRAGMIRGDWIKPGATVIDVGINRVPGANGKSKLVGDVAFAECAEVAGAITPVPGGVGPMTIACLMVNTVRAACAIAGLPAPAV